VKSIVIRKPGEVLLEERDVPRPQAGEALLKLLYGGICGSDLNAYRGTSAYVSYPCVPGHEFSAQIIEIEENDRGLEPGMFVTANPYFNCGTCYSCRRGLVNCCTDNQTMGVQREGAFSAYITMPIERLYTSAGLDPLTLALLEPFCISYHGIDRGQVKMGDKVLVVGGGTIGILAAVAAKARGALVYVADVAPGKLALAEKFGIDGTIYADNSEAYKRAVEQFTDGDGFDVTVEAAGLPLTFQACIDHVAFGGNVVMIGVSQQSLDFSFTVIQKKELHIYGSRNAQRSDFEQAIALVKSGAVNLADIVTDTYCWEDVARAFSEFDREAGNKLKVVLDFINV